VRGADIRVNGGEAVEVHFPVTGYDWERDVLRGFVVRLDGFEVEKENSVSISASIGGGEGEFPLSGWAPELDRIGVVS